MQDYSGDPTQAMAMLSGMMGIFMLVGLVFLVLWIVFWWQIFKKAGYSGALSLIFLVGIVPLIGWIVPIVLVGWFAFSDWPVRRGAVSPPQA